MKANEILKAITGSDKAGKEVKEQCKIFAEIFQMMKGLEGITEVSVSEAPFYLVSYSTGRYGSGKYTVTTSKGTEMPGEVWIIKTAKGTYKQTIPTGNEFYFAFMRLFAGHLAQTERAIVASDFEFEFTKEQSTLIRKAAKFASTDQLRPALMNVRIELEPGSMKVIATDQYRVFVESCKLSFGQDLAFGLGLLIPAKAIKGTKEGLKLELFKDGPEFKTGKLNGVDFEYCNDRYPDVMQVWPTYEKYVEVSRQDLIQSLKTVVLCANKWTHKVDFHFNGSCEMSARDLDYSNDSKASIEYSAKTASDFDISFNGKFLIECLDINKQKTRVFEDKVRIYSGGKSNKAVLIDSNLMLIPVMATD